MGTLKHVTKVTGEVNGASEIRILSQELDSREVNQRGFDMLNV